MPKRPPARVSMPAGAEAVRAERAARRAEQAARAAGARGAGRTGGTASTAAPRPIADTGAGSGIIRASWIGTALFVVGAVLATAVPDLRLPVVVMNLVLFFGGIVVFFWAWATAAARSREREITLWNLVTLEGIAPARVRWSLLGSLAVEIVVALATAWVSVALAFGILVPMWAEGLSWLWGARHGVFGPRKAPTPRDGGKRPRAKSRPRQ